MIVKRLQLTHLISRVHFPAAGLRRQGTSRRLPPFDRFAHFKESEGKSLSVLLDEFGRLRAENLATLAAWRLTATKLALTGEHPEFGAVTLCHLLATWVVYDLGHIAQTVRVMAKQYRDAIGALARVLAHRGPTKWQLN